MFRRADGDVFKAMQCFRRVLMLNENDSDVMLNMGRFLSHSAFRFEAMLLSVLFSLAGLSACNTMEGLGKDIQKVGDSIEDAANR